MSAPGSAERGRRLRAAYRAACRLELRALKPGNVHVHAGGHAMSLADFAASARVSAPPLTVPGATVGARILAAIEATRAAVGQNTNLGIVLLAAPLLAAAEIAPRGALRPTLATVLGALTVADAVAAYSAIRLAAPAGLGRVAEQDAAGAPGVDLRRAMALAAERDRVARQYATGYADVFAVGLTRLEVERRRGTAPEWAASHVYMDFLAAFPDSHLARKHGAAVAEAVRAEAEALAGVPAHERPTALLAFDERLKRRGLNPGTSADLTVASLLAAACEHILGGEG
jgi:triphosphoribosyl-dephospho-CoA synthase